MITDIIITLPTEIPIMARTESPGDEVEPGDTPGDTPGDPPGDPPGVSPLQLQLAFP